MTPDSTARLLERLARVREMVESSAASHDLLGIIDAVTGAVPEIVMPENLHQDSPLPETGRPSLASGGGPSFLGIPLLPNVFAHHAPRLEFVDDPVRTPMGEPTEPRYPDGTSTDLGQGYYSTTFTDGSVIVDHPPGDPRDDERVLHTALDGPGTDANMYTVHPGYTQVIFNRRTEYPGGYIFEPGDIAKIDNYGNIYAGRAPDFDARGIGELIQSAAPGPLAVLGRLWRAGKALNKIPLPTDRKKPDPPDVSLPEIDSPEGSPPTTPQPVPDLDGVDDGWTSHTEAAGDIANKYVRVQVSRDPASAWYHEELSNQELIDSINNAEPGDAIAVTPDGKIVGGNHRLDELQRRIEAGLIDPNTPIRVDVMTS